MSEPTATSETDDSGVRATRWGLVGLIAGGTIIAVLVGVVGVRAIVASIGPPLGVTAAADLKLGSCLAEESFDLEEFTVVTCSEAHPQQVVGLIEMDQGTAVYTDFSAMTIYLEAVCDRFLEYGLFLSPDVKNDAFDLTAIAIPTEQEFAAGQRTALCSLTSLDGAALVGDYYRPLPG